jgi:hypothetical protein
MTFLRVIVLFYLSIGGACRVRSFGFFDVQNERTLMARV